MISKIIAETVRMVQIGPNISPDELIVPTLLCITTGTAFAFLANRLRNGTFLYPITRPRGVNMNTNANAIIQTVLMLRQGG